MFTKKQLSIITEVGREGLSLRAAASRLKMTSAKFLEKYEDDEEAQLAFEEGQADLELEVTTYAREGMKQGTKHSFEHFANVIKNAAKGVGSGKVKENIVPSALLNTRVLLTMDDKDLQSAAAAKADQAERDSEPVHQVEEEEIIEEEILDNKDSKEDDDYELQIV